MIRRIMVKDFDHFYDRSPVDWGHEVWDNLLDFLPGKFYILHCSMNILFIFWGF